MVSTYYLIKLLQNANSRKANRKKYVPSAPKFNSQTCRVCLQQGVIPIFSKKNSYDFPLSHYLKVICEIDITANDANPQYLCKPCSDILDAAIKLRNTAKVTQSKLQEISSSRQYINNSYNETDIEVENDPEVSIPPHQTTQTEYQPTQSPHRKKEDTMLKLKEISLKYPNNEITIVKEGKNHINDIEIQNEDKPLEKYFKQVFTNGNKPLFQCLICKKVYKKYSTSNHLTIHRPDSEFQYVCEFCGKKCRNYSIFYKHRIIHSNEFAFKCNLCPYKGRCNTQLQGHIKRVHIRKYNYKCTLCPKQFIDINAFRYHIRRHGNPDFRCTTCHRSFYERSVLNSHIKIHHMGDTTLHNCDVCGNTYKRRKNLLVHQIKAHKRKKVFNNRANYLKLENENATVQLPN